MMILLDEICKKYNLEAGVGFTDDHDDLMQIQGMTQEKAIQISTENSKLVAKAEVTEIHSQALQELTGNVSGVVRDTYSRKSLAASALFSGSIKPAQIALLEQEATKKAITIEALARRIQVKEAVTDEMIGFASAMLVQANALIDATAQSDLSGAVQKIREAAKDAVKQAKSFAKIVETSALILSEGDPEKLTAEGKPKVEVLEAMTGIPDISAQQRDAAVALLTQ